MTEHDPLFDEEPKGMVARILPPLILICAFGGFVALAIYAYKAGSQSVGPDGELMVIEADNSPVKEKPDDPGGMEFPNQDKTIFETFSVTDNEPPKVERVLPSPEEPMIEEVDPAEPTTWVNKTSGEAKTVEAEEVFGEVVPSAGEEKKPAPQVKIVNEELAKQAVADPTPEPKAIEVKEEPVVVAEPVNATPEEVKVVEKPVAKPAAKPAGGVAKEWVQLGAYQEESAARKDFARLQKKYSELSGLSSAVNRADLGEKGIFYRLRVKTVDAKALCQSLSAAGQACMVVH